MKKPATSIPAMAFYHEDGFVSAWQQAMQFAGKKGRIGTMLDVVDARTATDINDAPWNTYYTTISAEYFGYSRNGKRIIIVAHGVGPLSTLQGIQKAYSYEYKDKTRSNRGGRITYQQFRDLESGKYGDVNIVDFDQIVNRHEYPFMRYMTCGMARFEKLLLARLGPRTIEYLEHQKLMAQQIHQTEHGKKIYNPYLIEMAAASNCFYVIGGYANHPLRYPFLEKGDGAIAHLLTAGRLENVSHQDERRVPYSLAHTISCHEWWNGVRLIAIRENSTTNDIHPGFGNIDEIILKNWQSLMRQNPQPTNSIGLRPIMSDEHDMFFTQYPKIGARMDNYEPEFQITSLKKVGQPVKFRTTIGGYHGFFKYDITEVETIKPCNANVYEIIGNPKVIWENGDRKYHLADIQFHQAKIDTSQRIIRRDELKNDFKTLMRLIEK